MWRFRSAAPQIAKPMIMMIHVAGSGTAGVSTGGMAGGRPGGSDPGGRAATGPPGGRRIAPPGRPGGANPPPRPTSVKGGPKTSGTSSSVEESNSGTETEGVPLTGGVLGGNIFPKARSVGGVSRPISSRGPFSADRFFNFESSATVRLPGDLAPNISATAFVRSLIARAASVGMTTVPTTAAQISEIAPNAAPRAPIFSKFFDTHLNTRLASLYGRDRGRQHSAISPLLICAKRPTPRFAPQSAFDGSKEVQEDNKLVKLSIDSRQHGGCRGCDRNSVDCERCRLKRQLRSAFDYPGLASVDRFLEFHKFELAVRIPSDEQVRGPLHRAGIEVGRLYSGWLGAMRASIGYLGRS